MGDPLFWHRLQFGFTATFHYLYPQLTMGLALLIVVFKTLGRTPGREAYRDVARFWIRVFGINFAVGVVTGIPMEFQFGTNWARFSQATGGVIGQTLAMEGMFAFFLESSFLGLLIWGEKKVGPKLHDLAAWALFLGSWLSGYFIVATNAFMQHPVGYTMGANGTFQLASFWAYVLNPWAIVQYAHNMLGAAVTGAFFVSAVGAFWALKGLYPDYAKKTLQVGVVVGLLASLLVAFPTGDMEGKLVAKHQPVTLAAMEGRFQSGTYAELSFIGQPDVAGQKLDNPIKMPGLLSFIAYGSFSSDVKGLNAFPKDQWPTNIELLYYGFHIMVGLGTLFIAIMGLSVLLLWKGRLERTRPLLWVLMLAFPFPFIANTAGWMVAELGRQPWLVYGLLRTSQGLS
ncbi:MAG TPA: cytochrome ubiquinol oxidase subunit I, partial [Holophaga sp.]|nr:cytochrome ubiquinol oxidase subunit I [Holophaga sp.]